MKVVTRLTTKGQIVIPAPIRDQLQWRAGQCLRVDTEQGVVILRPASEDIDELLNELSGCLSEGDGVGELELEHRSEIEADERMRSSSTGTQRVVAFSRKRATKSKKRTR